VVAIVFPSCPSHIDISILLCMNVSQKVSCPADWEGSHSAHQFFQDAMTQGQGSKGSWHVAEQADLLRALLASLGGAQILTLAAPCLHITIYPKGWLRPLPARGSSSVSAFSRARCRKATDRLSATDGPLANRVWPGLITLQLTESGLPCQTGTVAAAAYVASFTMARTEKKNSTNITQVRVHSATCDNPPPLQPGGGGSESDHALSPQYKNCGSGCIQSIGLTRGWFGGARFASGAALATALSARTPRAVAARTAPARTAPAPGGLNLRARLLASVWKIRRPENLASASCLNEYAWYRSFSPPPRCTAP
jgi:hypothetical protein